jgi:hypothetical protein
MFIPSCVWFGYLDKKLLCLVINFLWKFSVVLKHLAQVEVKEVRSIIDSHGCLLACLSLNISSKNYILRQSCLKMITKTMYILKCEKNVVFVILKAFFGMFPYYHSPDF